MNGNYKIQYIGTHKINIGKAISIVAVILITTAIVCLMSHSYIGTTPQIRHIQAGPDSSWNFKG